MSRIHFICVGVLLLLLLLPRLFLLILFKPGQANILNNDIFYLFYDEYDHKHFQNFVNVLSSYEIRRKNLDEIDQIFVIVRSSFFLTIKKKKILPPNVDFHTE